MITLDNSIRIKPRNLFHDLMLGLFYPAVLGAIFYSFLSFFANYNDIPRNIIPFLVIAGTLLHFTIDFIQTSTARKYNAVTFGLDLCGLLLLYLAFHFVNYHDRPPNYGMTALCFGVLYVCYLLFDIITLAGYKYFLKTFVSCTILSGLFFLLWLIRTPGWALVILLALASIRLTWLVRQDTKRLASTKSK